MPVMSLVWHEFEIEAEDEKEAFGKACDRCPGARHFGSVWDSEIKELKNAHED